MFFDSQSADKLSFFSTENSHPILFADHYLQRFHQLLLLKPFNEETIINHLKSTPDVLMLINLSLNDEKLALWCEHKKMKEFWDEVWRRADRNPSFTEAQQNPALIYRGLRPQLNISSYRLVCGLTIFSSAEHLIKKGHAKNSEEVVSLLKQASELGCYQALNALTLVNIDKLHNNEFEVPEIIIIPLYNAALWHGTPGYLLCALTLFHIASHYISSNNMLETYQAYQNGLTYLYIANYCETASEDEIYNAYNGEGFTANDLWDFDSIEQLITYFSDESKIDSQAISRARFTAYNLAQNYLNLRQANMTSSPNYSY